MGVIDSTPLGGMFYNPQSDEEKARKYISEGLKTIQDVPDPEYVPVEFRGPEYAGDVYSRSADAALVGPTAYDRISLDPNTRATQMAQIAALNRIREAGGLTLADEANLQKIQNQELAKEKAQREAILQNARARGVAGGGSEIMALLMANQAGTNRQSQRNMDIAGMAQERALQAGSQAANLAGNMRGQDYSQEAQKAAAADAAARFNASMISNTNQFNVGNEMRAGLANQATRQGTMNLGSQAANEQQRINRLQMPAQSFADKLAKARAQGEMRKSMSDMYQGAAERKMKQQGELWGGMGKLGMQALSSFGGAGGGSGGAGGSSGSGGAKSGQPMGSGEYDTSPYDNTYEGIDNPTPEDEYQPYA